jgi:hypothetical protein
MDRLPAKLQSAIRFNFKLCEPYCSSRYNDAPCEGMNIQRQLDDMLAGDFAEKRCPFDTGGSPTVALPDGACLAVFPPPLGRAEDEEDEKEPENVCPQIALARWQDGRPVTEKLAVPPRSMLRRPVVCCVPIDLAIDAQGRIEVTPSDNPPEDCHSGHRAAVQQDILRLQQERLVLEHGLDPDSD